MIRNLTKDERNLLRHYLQVLSEQARMVRNAVEPETGVMRITVESWKDQWSALTRDLDSVTSHMDSPARRPPGELAQEIADLAAKLADYGGARDALDAEGILRILLADSIIAVIVDLG